MEKIEKIKNDVLKIIRIEEREEHFKRSDIEKEILECEETISRNKEWLKELDKT